MTRVSGILRQSLPVALVAAVCCGATVYVVIARSVAADAAALPPCVVEGTEG